MIDGRYRCASLALVDFSRTMKIRLRMHSTYFMDTKIYNFSRIDNARGLAFSN